MKRSLFLLIVGLLTCLAGFAKNEMLIAPDAASDILIDATHFPDANFRQWVSENCDTDGNGALSESELAKTHINVQGKNIANLKGIEYFTALTSLRCSQNQLTALDLSKNTALTDLRCYQNQLTALDVSANTKLATIYCYQNRIRGMAMSNFIASLPTVSSGELRPFNNIEGVDEQNTYTTADVLAAIDKHWKVVDPNAQPLILFIDADNIPDAAFRGYISEYVDRNGDGILSIDEAEVITEMDISGLGIADLTGINRFNNLEHLDFSHNSISSYSILSKSKLTTLICNDNQLTTLNLRGSNLTTIRCYNNQLASGGMSSLITLLHDASTECKLVAYCTVGNSEGNVKPTDTNVAKANSKNWHVYTFDGIADHELFSSNILLDKNNFPSANFLICVRDLVDTNKDGSLSEEERLAVTELRVQARGITSIKGIEFFPNLTLLDCSYNQLTEIDLSRNTRLQTLYCQWNQLTGLDLSYNPDINDVSCYGNKIYSRSMDDLLYNLPTASADGGRIIIKDTQSSDEQNNFPSYASVSLANDKNWKVYTRTGYEVTEVEVLKDVQINAMNFPDENFRNFVSSNFDWDENGILNNYELQNVDYIACSSLEIASLKGVEFFPKLTELQCQNNKLTTLDLSKNKLLKALDVNTNKLTALDVTNNRALTYLSFYSNNLTAIDLSNNVELTYLNCESNELTTLDASNNVKLTFLDCNWNKLTSVNVSNLKALEYFYCGENELTTLDLSDSRDLQYLGCSYNPLTVLDVTKNKKLERLGCYCCAISDLKVTGCPFLSSIDCTLNSLTSLDVSGCSSLNELWFGGNNISGTNIDILVESLPKVEDGTLVVVCGDYYDNICTASQMFVARKKGWKVWSSHQENYLYDTYVGALPIEINETYFPDPVFRRLVFTDYDLDKNGQLDVDDVIGVSTMDVSSYGIGDLTGIEYFYVLQELNCSNNKLSSLDMAYNGDLKKLQCYKNRLQGDAMQKFFDDLHRANWTTPGQLVPYYTGSGESNSKPTNAQVAKANKRNWDVYSYDGNSYTEMKVAEVDINETNFPDEIFRTYVSNNIDKDHNGKLTYNELDVVEELNVAYMGIMSMKGVEYFTELKELICHNNELTALDVSANTKLTRLACGQNKIQSLDVTKLTELANFHCSNNQLTTLNVTKNTKLWRFYCARNQLTKLDVTKNIALDTLYCWGNPLGTLDVSQNKVMRYLSCFDSQLTSLDVTKNTALEILVCDYNKLTTLDVTKNTALKNLVCNYNQLTSLDVTKNTALTDLTCTNNQLTTLDVTKNTALKGLDCSSNQLTTLDLTKNTALEYLYCGSNQLTTLDVTKNTALEYLYCYSNQLTTLDMTKNTALEYISCSNNQLNTLDVTKNTALVQLFCYSNQLTSLDVTKNTALEFLSCFSNKLNTLDLSNNKELLGMTFYNNHIRGAGMDNMLQSLYTPTKEFSYIIYLMNETEGSNEQNFCTKAQVEIANNKNWVLATTYDNCSSWYFYYGADLIGDVNGDGTVGIGDIVAITNVMAGIETDPDVVSRANVNGDESVGIGDIVAITNIMAGIED